MTAELHPQLDRSEILTDVDRYFSEKVRAHGARCEAPLDVKRHAGCSWVARGPWER